MSTLQPLLPRFGRALAIAAVAVAVATVAVTVLEDRLAVPNASSVYLAPSARAGWFATGSANEPRAGDGSSSSTASVAC